MSTARMLLESGSVLLLESGEALLLESSVPVAPTTGTASGSSTVAGVGGSIAAATGTASGSATASGVGASSSSTVRVFLPGLLRWWRDAGTTTAGPSHRPDPGETDWEVSAVDASLTSWTID